MSLVRLVFVLLVASLSPVVARADVGGVAGVCDVIQSASARFRADLGFITRPGLVPDLPATVSVPPAICAAQRRSTAADFRLRDVPAGCDNSLPDRLCAPVPASALALSAIFTPPAGPPNAVVLAEDCARVDVSACNALGVPVTCIGGAVSADRLRIIEEPLPGLALVERSLRFTFPDTGAICAGGATPGAGCTSDAQCGGGRCGLAGAVCLGGPTSGASCAADSECGGGRCGRVALAGPVTVAVTLAGDGVSVPRDPVPCGLASARCRDFDGRLVSCADDLYRLDGTCAVDEAAIDPDSINVTALPVPVRLSDICAAALDPAAGVCLRGPTPGFACAADADCGGGSCGACRAPSGTPPIAPITQDRRGNLLGIVDARSILVEVGGESFPWLLRSGLALQGRRLALAGGGPRAVNWSVLHPLFFGVADPDAPGEGIASVDAAFGIQRGIRRACADAPGRACSFASECDCSIDSLAGLPNPLPASAGGAGPVLAECPLDQSGVPVCRLLGTVSIDVLLAADRDDRALAVPVNECVAGALPDTAGNADGDALDVVMTLFDRLTGIRQPLGVGGVSGRATTRIFAGFPQGLPSQDVDDTIVAFLEPEVGECAFDSAAPLACDTTRNGAVFEHALRVFRVGSGGALAEELTPRGAGGALLAAQPDPNVNQGPVAVSDGLVFFRTPIDARVRSVALASGVGGNAPSGDASVSADGGFVAFSSAASNLGFKDDRNKLADVFLRNRATGALLAASVMDGDGCADRIRFTSGASGAPVVSSGGRHVAFESVGDRLLGPPSGPPADRNNVSDVFVHDFQTCRTRRVSVTSAGLEANGPSRAASISADGRFVAFESRATNLAAGAPVPAVYLRDRDTDEDGVFDEPGAVATLLVAGGAAASGAGVAVDASVALTNASQVFVSDGETGALELASSTPTGAPGNGVSLEPAISANGRWITFQSRAGDLAEPTEAPGDVDQDVFVYDRVDGGTRRAGVLRTPRECRALDPGLDPNGDLSTPQVSEDGRFLVYTSTASNLVPGDSSGSDVFIEDLRTGSIARVSQRADGGAPSAASSGGSLSGDAGVVAFSSSARNLVTGQSPLNTGADAIVSALPVASAGTRSALAVLDTTSGELLRTAALAEFVEVAAGAAILAAPGESVKLVRRACGGAVGGGACDASCGSGCALVVEDLLRPSISSADAIAISERFACAVVSQGGVPTPACHEIGSPPSASLDPIAPASIRADSIQVSGSNVVFTSPEPGGRALYVMDLEREAQPRRSRCEPDPTGACRVRDVVLGDDGIVCFSSDESDLGIDQNGDTRLDDAVMFVADPSDAVNQPVRCPSTVTRCSLSACDPRQPFLEVPARTCKFLVDEEGSDLNENGVTGEVLVRRCTLGIDNSEAVMNLGDGVDAASSRDPFSVESGGDLDRVPACVDPARPRVPEGACPCSPGLAAAGYVCSDALPIRFTDNRADTDGDGQLDKDEFCDGTANPDPRESCGLLTPAELPTFDCDEDGVADACDAFVCGDGLLQRRELCDPSVTPVGCSANCTPEVRVDVTEQSINPGKEGVVPATLLSGPLLNLDVVPVDGQPPRMIAIETLRWAAVAADGSCPGGGAPDRDDLRDDRDYLTRLGNDENADGRPDLSLHLEVQGSGISDETIEVCVTGEFSLSLGDEQAATFEARDTINVTP